MALISPGVQVSVIDESFYTPAEPGTRPLFVVATAANKSNGAGTGTAQGTLAVNAGKVYTITSQRELVDTFGDPVFKVDSNNNPIHAGEQNEYGLQAAYSYLGVSNSALVVRANLDLSLLDAQADAPGGEPQDGTFWLDTATSTYGIFEWNGRTALAGGQQFTNKTPRVILDGSKYTVDGPNAGEGVPGDYAFAPGKTASGSDFIDDHILTLWFKSRFTDTGTVGAATWVKVGSDGWRAAWPTVQASNVPNDTWLANATIIINGVEVTAPGGNTASLASAVNQLDIPGVSARIVDGYLQLYVTDVTVDTITIGEGTGAITTALGITPGIFYAPKLAIDKHTAVPQWKKNKANNTDRPTGSVWIKTTEPNLGARWRVKLYNTNTNLWTTVESPLFASNQAALAEMSPAKGGLDLAVNSVYVQYNFNGPTSTADVLPVAEFRVMRRRAAGATTITSKEITAGLFANGLVYNFRMAESLAGSANLTSKEISFTGAGTTDDANRIVQAINNAGFSHVEATVTSGKVVVTHRTGGEILFADQADSTYVVETLMGLFSENTNNVYQTSSEDGVYAYVASNWVPMTITLDTSTAIKQMFYISNTAPETLPADGTLWYSSVVDEVDIMVHNGETWVGYKHSTSPYYNASAALQTNPTGPIVTASEPRTQVDGTDLVNGDLWIDTSDIENYPVIKRWNGDFSRWDTIDTSDQTSEDGVLFADARAGTSGGQTETNTAPSGTIEALLTSNFLDFDAPDPALYPRGMLLWNLRRSGYNVKKFVRNYIVSTDDNLRYKSNFNDVGDRPTSGDSQAAYYPHRWVTESANQADGSGSFGRKAQRQVVVQALQALVNSNQEIRDTERNGFNLLAAPGYPELIGELISLNYDRKLTAFVVGDSPARLRPDATTVNNWGTNLAGALEDNDNGLASFDEYLGVFYPWGYTSDNAGRNVAVPPSHMILRMMALSDQVSYPWFAPAGTRRGGITNATAVGYITSEGEFQSVALNEGQRDTLYNVKVNPITYFTGAGLVNFGQKTRAKNASAMDRINVVRLVIYLRNQLNKLAKPYIFEPNDKITRDEIKQQVESLLLELVGQRALYDFLVVCDESNNTPNRIDRNELYVDIAIEPVKAVEFIYIPVRLKNTGEIAGLG